MGTIFYPPGWDGPVDPAGQVVGGPTPPPAAMPAPPSQARPTSAGAALPPPPPAALAPPPPPAVTPLQPAQLPAAGRIGSPHRRLPVSAPSLSALRGKPVIVIAAVLAVALIAIAVNQNSVAKKWRDHEHVEAARNQTLSSRLNEANATLTTMSAQLSSLQGHVSRLKSQLSAVANAKEKAIDQETLFKEVAVAAGRVSDALSGCVNDMRGLISEIAADVSSSTFDPYLESNAASAGDACAYAQNANAALQNEISGVG
jgi:hypothetical protein